MAGVARAWWGILNRATQGDHNRGRGDGSWEGRGRRLRVRLGRKGGRGRYGGDGPRIGGNHTQGGYAMRHARIGAAAVCGLLMLAGRAGAEIKTQTIEYQQG